MLIYVNAKKDMVIGPISEKNNLFFPGRGDPRKGLGGPREVQWWSQHAFWTSPRGLELPTWPVVEMDIFDMLIINISLTYH